MGALDLQLSLHPLTYNTCFTLSELTKLLRQAPTARTGFIPTIPRGRTSKRSATLIISRRGGLEVEEEGGGSVTGIVHECEYGGVNQHTVH